MAHSPFHYRDFIRAIFHPGGKGVYERFNQQEISHVRWNFITARDGENKTKKTSAGEKKARYRLLIKYLKIGVKYL